jgi:hypothetical protein
VIERDVEVCSRSRKREGHHVIQTYSSQQYQERHEPWVKLTIIVFIERQTLFFVVKVMGSTMTNSELWLAAPAGKKEHGNYRAPSILESLSPIWLRRKWIDPHFSTGNKAKAAETER